MGAKFAWFVLIFIFTAFIMNNSVDPLEQKSPAPNPLRAALRSSVAEPHQLLDQIPLMQRYASGATSAEEYMAVTRTMLSFWAGYAPATHHLPKTYRGFFESYLDALQLDVGACPPVTQVEAVEELAFYYVLLGSGMGAKVILRNNCGNDFSKSNLYHLAQNSTPLWKDFNHSYLPEVSFIGADRVMKDSRRMFDTLLSKIQKITWETL